MKGRIYIKMFIVGLLVLGSPAYAENSIEYSYDVGDSERAAWGTSKKEEYDVALRLDGKNLAGKRVTEIRIPLNGSDGISGFKVWMSKELALQTVNGSKVVVPDIMSVDAVPDGDGLNVVLDTPYEITDEGVFVGYSFKIDELTDKTKKPLVVVPGTNANGLYLHTSRTYLNWMNMAEIAGCVSSATVIISGGFEENSVALLSAADVTIEMDEVLNVPVVMANHGLSEVRSIDYAYEVAGVAGDGHLDMEKPLAVNYNRTVETELPLPSVGKKGHFGLKLTITAVNGVENKDLEASVSSVVDVLSFVPVHRPLLEEYTGLWCGWCPKGFVGLELMSKYYGDDFVALSYHNHDDMEIMNNEDYPSYVSGYPAAWLDRQIRTDAYFGNSNTGFGIDELWKQRASLVAPASIDLEARWSDTEKTGIDVTAKVVFNRNMTGTDYRLAYALVADDLYDESWKQVNYFYGNANYLGMEGLDRFINGAPEMSGLHFNDVIICGKELKGIAGSLPSDIEDGREYTHSYSFDLAEAVNTAGTSLVQDKANLRVVGILVDAATGEIVNSNKTWSETQTALNIADNTAGYGEVESVSFYDMAGCRVSAPAAGVYIKAVQYKNGKTKTSKVVLR